MDFAKGEILEKELRLIASAVGLGPLIAGRNPVCDQRERLEFYQRFSPPSPNH
jgi:hypothetical protein